MGTFGRNYLLDEWEQFAGEAMGGEIVCLKMTNVSQMAAHHQFLSAILEATFVHT